MQKLREYFAQVQSYTLSEHRYSNSNYILLAALVERLSGMPMVRYAKQVLFEPPGMQHLAFDDDRSNLIPNFL